MKGKELLEDLQGMTPEQLEYPIEICFAAEDHVDPEFPDDPEKSFQLHADDPMYGTAVSDKEQTIFILGSKVGETFIKLFMNEQEKGKTDEKPS